MIAGGRLGELRRPLTLEDREEISRCLAMCLTNKEIAAHIERDESVVCREIARNGGREKYRAHRAQARAEEDSRRPDCGDAFHRGPPCRGRGSRGSRALGG